MILEPLAMPRTIHVAYNGNDNNSGLTRAAALATFSAAMIKLSAVGGGRLIVDGTNSDPITNVLVHDLPHAVTVEGYAGKIYMNVSGNPCVLARGTGVLTLSDADLTSTTSGVIVGATGMSGRVVASSVTSRGGTNGWQTLDGAVYLTCTSCTGLGTTNDVWNVNGTSTVTLTDCIADGCGDEGASPHDSAYLILRATAAGRSHFNDNTESGMAAVASARCDILGPVVLEGNGTGGFYGGAFYYDHAYGTIGEYTPGDGGPIFRNNVKWGVNADGTDGTMTYGTYTSTRNGLADLL